jgi:hypothetical protein
MKPVSHAVLANIGIISFFSECQTRLFRLAQRPDTTPGFTCHLDMFLALVLQDLALLRAYFRIDGKLW